MSLAGNRNVIYTLNNKKMGYAVDIPVMAHAGLCVAAMMMTIRKPLALVSVGGLL